MFEKCWLPVGKTTPVERRGWGANFALARCPCTLSPGLIIAVVPGWHGLQRVGGTREGAGDRAAFERRRVGHRPAGSRPAASPAGERRRKSRFAAVCPRAPAGAARRV